MTTLIITVLVFTAWPAVLFLLNLRLLQPPARNRQAADEVAILIPARDEARNIENCVRSALANEGAEVIVLDDNSSDETRAIVARIAADEPRLRLLPGAPLPEGWCGKNWACVQLARSTDRPVFLFIDADVRLAPNAAADIAAWMEKSGAQLASGIPRQLFGTFSEKLLIPLIHFVLLAYLPLGGMRRRRHPAYATACGQLIAVTAAAYRAIGGHGSIRTTLHDGLALPRRFREARYHTDLFDATPLATCRMYQSDAATWKGLGRNAHEAMGSPGRILPFTLLLGFGQIAPFVLLALMPWLTATQVALSIGAVVTSLLPRMLAARRFQQPFAFVFLHPVAITGMLALQWAGLVRYLRGASAQWKGREYSARNRPIIAIQGANAEL